MYPPRLSRAFGQRVDLARGITGAEAVVDVHDGQPAGATIKHAEQRREPAEVGAIAHARRHRDDRLRHQPGNHTRQGAFHARDDDDDVGPLDSFQAPKQPVYAGHAYVRDSLHAIAHHLGRDRRFLGHWQIAGAGANHRNGPGPFGQGLVLEGHTPRQLVINGALEMPAQSARMFGRGPSDQHPLLAGEELGRYLHHLLRRLARAKDDFGEPSAQRAVSIDLRKAEVRYRRRLELAQNLVTAYSARSELFQEFDCFRRGHLGTLPPKVRAVTAKVNTVRNLATFKLYGA